MASDGNHALADHEDRKAIVLRYQQGREKLLGKIDDWEDPQFELYHVTDRYGFIHKNHLPERLTQYENKIRELEATRSRKWIKMLSNWDQFENAEKLRQRVYKGIPNQVRGQAWCALMGVSKVKETQEGRYQEMLRFGLENSPDIRQIDLDVNRTFRNNIMFRDRYCVKQQELFRILVAYSVYNSEIGYCQGMSQIAALLLMYISDEEDAFWAMDRLMSSDKYAMHGFFIPGFPKLVRFARHHDRVLKRYLPRVFKHFKKYDIDSTLYTLKWFFQCFLDRVPFSLTLRLWDCFMLEGEVILTCMSYTLLKLHKKTVIKKGMEELIEFLQIDLEKDFGYHDDEAINALLNSINELRRHKYELPTDPPLESEKPTKPFGFLLHADNVSISTAVDGHSVAGSINLNHEVITHSSSDESLTHIADEVKQLQQEWNESTAANKDIQAHQSTSDQLNKNDQTDQAKQSTHLPELNSSNDTPDESPIRFIDDSLVGTPISEITTTNLSASPHSNTTTTTTVIPALYSGKNGHIVQCESTSDTLLKSTAALVNSNNNSSVDNCQLVEQVEESFVKNSILANTQTKSSSFMQVLTNEILVKDTENASNSPLSSHPANFPPPPSPTASQGESSAATTITTPTATTSTSASSEALFIRHQIDQSNQTEVYAEKPFIPRKQSSPQRRTSIPKLSNSHYVTSSNNSITSSTITNCVNSTAAATATGLTSITTTTTTSTSSSSTTTSSSSGINITRSTSNSFQSRSNIPRVIRSPTSSNGHTSSGKDEQPGESRVTISVSHEMDAEKVRIFVPYQNTVSPSDGRRDGVVDKVNERSAVPLVDT